MNASESSDAVRMENVRKTYFAGGQEVHALDGISVRIAKGSFCAIMGASGSGKSTALNILGCLDRPTSGSYYLDGQNVNEMDDESLSGIRLKYLGFIFQSFNLIPQLTVSENIALPLYYQGIPEEESMERARELAKQVGLSARLDHKPAELSGGQQQRVAIARAISNDPVLVLADEPTGNLDSVTSGEIMNLLTEMNRRGKTIVMVTHEPGIAEYAGCRFFMKDGRIDRIS